MKTLNIEVPETLIPALGNEDFNGPILLYMNGLHVTDGFALSESEFVTSLDALEQASMLAGLTP